jgi:pimeloyl-ACP methyl ester carboxylesterase
MPFADIADQKLFYAARGETGAPVVFVHGAGSNHLIWNAQLAALADVAHVHAPDLTGHGRSTGASRASIRAYADLVCAFLDALALERAIIVGHSMGGAIAQTLALEYPARVLGLGLVGTGARLRVRPAFLDGVLDDFPTTAHQITQAEFAPSADERLKQLSENQLLECSPQVVHDDLAACDAFDVIARVGEMLAPTLILCGREDQMTPVKYSEFLAAKIPHARLELIDGAGHLAMLEQPEAVNRALREWLAATRLP